MSGIPALLLERLKKRGILRTEETSTQVRASSKKSNNASAASDTHAEEVFAESYDNAHESDSTRASERREASRQHKVKVSDDAKRSRFDSETNQSDSPSKSASAFEAQESENYALLDVADCPNLSNPYHECSDYCKQRWGLKLFRPASETLRKRSRLLKCYPLPADWLEIADPESGRFYYANLETNQVCWLPPTHPQAQLAFPPAKRRAPPVAGAHAVIERPKISYRNEPQASDVSKPARERSQSDSDSGDESHSQAESEASSERSDSGARDRGRAVQAPARNPSAAARRKQVENRPRKQNDPMDPSSYSECPPGSWADGLEFAGGGRKKDAADSTASGALYEMRPLPTPGAILRMNAEQQDASTKRRKTLEFKTKRPK